jgi:hypothetical protein
MRCVHLIALLDRVKRGLAEAIGVGRKSDQGMGVE